ncbi:uncharacterized protein LOC131026208 [Salvia miltiorrhiza]|uniref:uncharacterized protein LOC131026208 n=1 Tax=Salvia miltiorrhiza TaxID=226208 RepID=UPI0025AB9294|nr:uncharacterized protein LOC131026208 [Salvia miltiorrhiza]
MSPSAATMGMIQESPKKTALEKKESIEKERQISVDPISMQPKTEVTLLPPPGKFVSCSLPNSPRFESSSAKHKKKHKNQPSPLTRQQSVALGNLERLRMQRSKSCGEGRVCQPSIDLDLWPSSADNEAEEGKTRGGKGDGGGGEAKGKSKGEDKFKCGACLFLPGLGKGKAVRARKEVEEEHADIVSQRVSLEKFECGSWRSSAIINSQEDGDSTSNLFFDLPLELMRCASVNDAESPVTTGFLFDAANRKGVPKIGKSHESRHVRFSTSSPTSPSPRLRNQRDDDFTAFLEAQSA